MTPLTLIENAPCLVDPSATTRLLGRPWLRLTRRCAHCAVRVECDQWGYPGGRPMIWHHLWRRRLTLSVALVLAAFAPVGIRLVNEAVR